MSDTHENSFEIRDESWDEIARLHARIPEFGNDPGADHYRARCAGHDHMALAAYTGGAAAGYVVAYDRYADGSLYCWMAGVLPQGRRAGALSALMAALEGRARAAGYDSIRIKTRNDKTAMLRWLVGNGYMFTAIDERTPLSDTRLLLRKTL